MLHTTCRSYKQTSFVFVFRRVQTGCHSGFEDGLNANIVPREHSTYATALNRSATRWPSDGGISMPGMQAAPPGGRSSRQASPVCLVPLLGSFFRRSNFVPTRTMGALGQYRCISGIHFLLTFSRLCWSAMLKQTRATRVL